MKKRQIFTNTKKLGLFFFLLLFHLITTAQITPNYWDQVFVRPGATGNGSSWSNATGDLQAAIDAPYVKEVFVAIGTYYVSATSAFRMKKGVAIYGGFDPDNGISKLSDNRILPNPSNLQGSVLDGNNSRGVIYNESPGNNRMDKTAILDGFTLTNGKSGNGGGIYNRLSSPLIRNVVIKNNKSDAGGGVWSYISDAEYVNVHIINNDCTAYSGGHGGGICGQFANLKLTNVVVANNKASIDGGGIWIGQSSSLSLTNVSITNNFSGDEGGGFYSNSEKGTNLTNVTIANNTPNAIKLSGSLWYIKNSILYGGITGSNYEANNSIIEGKTSTINENISASGITLTSLFNNPASADYTLKLGSPVINKGNNIHFPNLNENTKDLAGNSRIYNFATGGIIDMGAYESSYNSPLKADGNKIIYVNTPSYGSGSGESWNNATDLLQDAINTTGVEKVFVAIGEYKVPSPNSFVMKNGVSVYGGFDPKYGIQTLSDNRVMPDPMDNQYGSVLNGKNERPVIWNVYSPTNTMSNFTVLDGFTIKNGSGSLGAGIHNEYASPTLSNLVISNNKAGNSGAGIYNKSSSPMIKNCVIHNNEISNTNTGAIISGAGIYNIGSSAPIIINTTITGNSLFAPTAGISLGGGIYSYGSSPKIYNSIIWNNLIKGSPLLTGADIFNEGNSSVTLKNSITQGYSTGNAGDNNLVNINPLFTNQEQFDYSLLDASPAINKGNKTLFIGLSPSTKDLAGSARVIGANIEIGAFENQNALPVHFGKLSASIKNNLLYVNWTTETESNNDHFLIQVSEDGISWHTIQTIQSKAEVGNSSVAISYSTSIPIQSAFAAAMVLLALGVFGTNKKQRICILFCSLLLSILFISCQKRDWLQTTEKGKLLVRIVQVDKDGIESFSKVIRVTNN